MIENNALGDVLKDYKNKQPHDSITPEVPGNRIYDNILTIFAGIMSVVKVFVFGYTAKIIFSADWKILGIVCVGLTTNFLLTYIHELIHPD